MDAGRIAELEQTRDKINAEINFLSAEGGPKLRRERIAQDMQAQAALCGQSTREKSPEEIIEQLFTYHPVTDESQALKYQMVRDAAKAFALAVWRASPYGADRTAAIRKIREAVMTANASIALNGLNL